MKAVSVVLVMIVALTAPVAMAGVYTYQPGPRDLDDLDHWRAYEWGIRPNLPDDETIVGASLFFNNLRNWNNQDNDLWVTLIPSSPLGVKKYYDGQGGGDYFQGWGTALVHYEDLPSSSQDRTYDFDLAEVGALRTYAADNNFGLGFDPDCHFYNCGITLTLETQTVPGPNGTPIPEPVTGSVLLGGVGMIVARRRRRK